MLSGNPNTPQQPQQQPPQTPPSGSGGNNDNVENVSFYQPVSIHQIINDLYKERSVDASQFKQENSANIISDHLQESTTIESLLIQPNVSGTNDQLIANIIDVVNEGGGSPVTRSILGTTVIDPGKIRILQVNGVIRVAGPGMFVLYIFSCIYIYSEYIMVS